MGSEILWDGFDAEVDGDHARLDQPAVTVLMHRSFPTYTESLWIHGYPGIKSILVTFPPITMGGGADAPGVVRSIPVGWRDMATENTFRAAAMRMVGLYEREGWKRKDETVRADR